MRLRRWCGLLVLLLAGLFPLGLGACGDLGYYRQAAQGQWDLLSRRRDIQRLIDDPTTAPDLRQKLTTILAIREFASRELGLPDNGSYRCYADLERPCVVWNVVAAPEFSLEPRRWCFPVAGCVPYRGYYAEAAAREFAAGLASGGDDVYVYGVTAYSTLGWFDDPVLNTFVQGPTAATAGLIFHELAHQQVYAKGDADFNEAFAMTVEIAGVERWLDRYGDDAARQAHQLREGRQAEFLALVSVTRGRLAALYGEELPAAEMRRAKAAILADMRVAHERLKASWQGYAGYDRWFAEPLNNGRFVAVNTYRRLLPAFQQLLAEQDGDLPRFYAAVQTLADLPLAARRQRLAALLEKSAG
ncbi:aminopeptidase [Desulfuromonas carbonis]